VYGARSHQRNPLIPRLPKGRDLLLDWKACVALP